MDLQDKIISALYASPKGMSAAELVKATSSWSGRLYVVLMEMERDGVLRSDWEDDPYPRRRLYYLKTNNPLLPLRSARP